MSNTEKKVVAVWIDNSEARLFATPNRSKHGVFEQIDKIESDSHSGSHRNDRSELAKDQQEQRKMFKEITNKLNDVDVIYIFGPGQAQEKLKNHLEENHHFTNMHIELGSTDTLNEHQMIDHLEKHFA